MRVILATSNRGKVREISKFLDSYSVYPFTDFIEPFEIVEDGDSFSANAIIKAKAVYQKLKELNRLDSDMIILSDDSGISIEALNGEPNIYSARYAGINASDRDNLNRVIDELKSLNIKSSKAYYTASIAIVYQNSVFTTHGWMHGDVLDRAVGENGFGYDPIFIPNGFSKTLGELDERSKIGLSHRSKAIESAEYILKILTK